MWSWPILGTIAPCSLGGPKAVIRGIFKTRARPPTRIKGYQLPLALRQSDHLQGASN